MAKDVLSRHKKNLEAYQNRYNGAVAAANCIVENLQQLEDNMEQEIDSIDAYREGLLQTRNDLEVKCNNTRRVLDNFKKLLCMDS